MYLEEQMELRRHIAKCYVETNGTVRKLTEIIHLSKTTIHNKLVEFVTTNHILEEDRELAKKVAQLMRKNVQERHIRGGMSTRKKYMQAKCK